MNKIIHGNCLDKLKELEENSVDSIVTDPPYELGFMGKSWDSTGIANNKDMWAECLRVLKPGGHLMAFSGTRTYHRMASAIEDAGFEVRDMIEWVYGSGFPKSTNIAIRIDKEKGLMKDRGVGTSFARKDMGDGKILANGKAVGKHNPISEEAKQYEGWGTALKPAHEPICMARKPLAEKTVAENVLKYGTGGINIDESRVEGEGYKYPNGAGGKRGNGITGNPANLENDKSLREKPYFSNNLGRFPANLIHDNSEEVRECFPSPSPASTQIRKESDDKDGQLWNLKRKGGIKQSFGDSGNASRFFKSIIYQAKASKSERNKGCEELDEKTIESDFGSGDIAITRSERIHPKMSNFHPTVKPVALMEYLIKMVTKPGGIVLDPFAGSGSTLVAAKENGFQYIGIEMTEEYIPIINARLGL